MAQLIVFVLLLATLGGQVLAKDQARVFYTPVSKSKSNRSALAAIPPGKVPLTQSITGPNEYTYTLGGRVTNDQNVFHAQEAIDFDQFVNAILTVTYQGLTVSYVKIRVTQTGTDGYGYVDTGAINTNAIKLIVKANGTKILYYTADIFAK